MSEDHNEFYANAVNVTTSIYDVTLTFRAQSPAAPPVEGRPPVMAVSQEVMIRMSPQHAKSLAAILVRHARNYEREHNTVLALPPEMQEMWDQLSEGAE